MFETGIGHDSLQIVLNLWTLLDICNRVEGNSIGSDFFTSLVTNAGVCGLLLSIVAFGCQNILLGLWGIFSACTAVPLMALLNSILSSFIANYS